MHRRMIVLTGALLLPGLAVAQATTGQPLAGSQPAAGPDETQHANATLAAGGIALETSRLALTRAGTLAKSFAELEIAEQETVAAVLRQRAHAPAQALEPKGQSMLGRLENTATGSAFDKAYITHQIEGHQELLELQEAYLGKGKDPYSRAVAMLARGHIREHLKDLATIQAQLA